ncbi:MAG TPA: AI-2E family transporter [Abditibacteriaceae bacterium]|nr:AI-2E family transporter [Abditibacteriaceae bacterium]
MNRTSDAAVLRYTGYFLLFALGAYLLYLVRGVLPLFMVAALLAYAMEPALKVLERRGYSRRGAVGFVALVFVLFFFLLVALLSSAWQQVQSLNKGFANYQKGVNSLVQQNQRRLDRMRLPGDVKKGINDAIEDFKKNAVNTVGTRLQGTVTGILGSLSTLLILLIVLPIITLWFMIEMNPLRARVLMLVPPIYRRDVTEIAGSINELLGRYVRGQMIVCGLFGVLCTITFHILHFAYGMDYPLVLGIAAAFLYIVPYIGMASLAAAAGLTAYFTSSSPVLCTAIAVGSCVVFNLVIDYGITPRVIGSGVGLHPLMVIFALLAGAQVGGILGMILAVPVTASLRVVAIYLFPQMAAPIPHTPPETNAPSQEAATNEVMQQTRDAEASTGMLPESSTGAP